VDQTPVACDPDAIARSILIKLRVERLMRK
jgi:hypothetical protein